MTGFCCVFNFSGVVWTEDIRYLRYALGVKPPFSNSSGVVWTGRETPHNDFHLENKRPSKSHTSGMSTQAFTTTSLYFRYVLVTQAAPVRGQTTHIRGAIANHT